MYVIVRDNEKTATLGPFNIANDALYALGEYVLERGSLDELTFEIVSE
jgi:hypothetical protein